MHEHQTLFRAWQRAHLAVRDAERELSSRVCRADGSAVSASEEEQRELRELRAAAGLLLAETLAAMREFARSSRT